MTPEQDMRSFRSGWNGGVQRRHGHSPGRRAGLTGDGMRGRFEPGMRHIDPAAPLEG